MVSLRIQKVVLDQELLLNFEDVDFTQYPHKFFSIYWIKGRVFLELFLECCQNSIQHYYEHLSEQYEGGLQREFFPKVVPHSIIGNFTGNSIQHESFNLLLYLHYKRVLLILIQGALEIIQTNSILQENEPLFLFKDSEDSLSEVLVNLLSLALLRCQFPQYAFDSLGEVDAVGEHLIPDLLENLGHGVVIDSAGGLSEHLLPSSYHDTDSSSRQHSSTNFNLGSAHKWQFN